MGWCAAANGEPKHGVALLTQALAALQATQSRHFMSYLLGLLTEACMLAGLHSDAMKAVKQGLALSHGSGERYYQAELLRLHGELLAGPAYNEKRQAELALGAAVKISIEQGAKALERKARESLRRWFN